MKKLALVMICALLMAVFIGFNYLLWDRENREEDIKDLEYSSNASINTLGREIKKLEDDNKSLQDRIASLEDNNTRLQTEIKQLQQDKLQIENALDEKNKIVSKLIKHTDLKILESGIKKWVDHIDKGEYEAAYELLIKSPSNKAEYPNVNDFANIYNNSVENIAVKSIELYTENVPEDKKGDIIFKVVLEVEMKKGNEDSSFRMPFNDGMNQRFIIVDYDVGQDAWLISSISAVI